MEVLIIIGAFLLVGAVSSALHGIIKPAVDWVSPPENNGHRAWVLLVEEGERIEREILAMQNKPTRVKPPKSYPDGARAVLHLLEQQAANSVAQNSNTDP